MSNWYTWVSLAAFDAWHDAAKAALGIPHPGVNAATGEVDESAQWTTEYTMVAYIGEGDWRAIVEPEVAALVPDGLGVMSEAPPQPDDPFAG